LGHHMVTNYPLLLLLNRDFESAVAEVSKLIADDQFVHIYNDSSPTGPIWRVIYKTITFGFQIGAVPAEIAGYERIFCTSKPDAAIATLSIGLDANVAGGERAAPIAATLLELGAHLCKYICPAAVAWKPGSIVTDPGYFCDAVWDYAGGGVFPALAVIGFVFSSDGELVRTSGLSWFSGQELELKGEGLDRADLARRAVRLIHDVAVNGPIAKEETISDISSDLRVILLPSEDGSIVIGHICSELDTIRH
jgi:hypothetical protein